MRKHFLILMLMALLPLAGWATVDITDCTLAVGDVVYGSTTQVITVNYNGPLEKGTHFTVDEKFYTKEDLSEYAKEGDTPLTLAQLSVGKYYVKIAGVPEYGFTGTKVNAFKVTPKPLTVTFTHDYKTTLTKYYLQPDPDQPVVPTANNALGSFAIDGLIDGDNVLDVLDFGAANAAHYDYGTANVNAGTYPVEITNVTLKTPEGATVPNYTLTKATDVTFKIKKVNLAEIPTGMELKLKRVGDDASFPYKGTDQAPEYIVTYGAIGDENPQVLVAGQENDYILRYSLTTENSWAAGVKNVGTYKVRVIGRGTNFANSQKTFLTAAYTFEITKADGLEVRVNVLSKTYDGSPFTATQARYTINGAQGNDKDLIKIVDNVDATAFKAAADNYNVKAVLTNATIGEGGPKVSDNYNITPATTPTTVWTIVKRQAKITVANEAGKNYVKAIAFDEELPNTTGTELETEAAVGIRGVLADDVDLVKAGYSIRVKEGFVKTEGLLDYYEVYRNASVTSSTDNDIVNMLANYDIVPVAGKLQINKLTLAIQPFITDKTYGDEINPDITVYYGTLPLTLKEGAEPEYLYSTDNTNFNVAKADVKNVGTYYVKVNWESIKDYAPTGYEIKAESCVPAVFTINPKTLKPIVGNQTLHIGDALAKIQTGGSVTYAEGFAPVINGETPEAPVYTYTITAEKVVTAVDAQHVERITGWNGAAPVENKVAHILEVALNGDNEFATLNGNYTIADDYVKGDLTLLDTYELNLGKPTIAADIADAAANGNKYKVTLPSLTLKANEWYAIVLPFETSALELVKQLNQYVVLNTYNVANSEPNHIVFSLEMGTIGAGVPFLVKAGADLNLTNKFFEAKDIVPAPVAQGTMEANGSIFAGVFSNSCILQDGYELDGATENQALAYRWLSHTTDTEGWSQAKNTWRSAKGSDHHRHALKALEAYLQVPVGANPARITVEDFDGQTTSIQTLNAGDLKAVTVDGWYTIDGIKLQSAPTQKGIYINNGKKVVLK
jgi:hypothetical protein